MMVKKGDDCYYHMDDDVADTKQNDGKIQKKKKNKMINRIIDK